MYAGPALIEAYRIGDDSQWLGISLGKSVQEDARSLQMKSGGTDVIINWDIPLKKESVNGYVVNWPVIYSHDLKIKPPTFLSNKITINAYHFILYVACLLILTLNPIISQNIIIERKIEKLSLSDTSLKVYDGWIELGNTKHGRSWLSGFPEEELYSCELPFGTIMAGLTENKIWRIILLTDFINANIMINQYNKRYGPGFVDENGIIEWQDDRTSLKIILLGEEETSSIILTDIELVKALIMSHSWKRTDPSNKSLICPYFDVTCWRKDSGDIIINFLNYCRLYFVDRAGLTPIEAQILSMDPILGSDLDIAKKKWLENLSIDEDPDDYLYPPDFDAPSIAPVIIVLKQAANEFEVRKPSIIEYLKTMDHEILKYIK